MGIDLYEEELPGGAVGWQQEEATLEWAPTQTRHFSLTVSQPECDHRAPGQPSAADSERAKRRQMKFQHNTKRLKSVFNQLSDNSNFLPLDLADEAIMLVTDNRLSFAGVVACLYHLKIGSLHMEQDANVHQALAALGLTPEAVVCDVNSTGQNFKKKKKII
eukprot:GHVT01043385.1.p2 GENE.GHVT01043385.1~~GHVT01043385.1.p2  ORF type:complete len:162 (-),score=35.53 GHVT01043385.1:3427-3912(-)